MATLSAPCHINPCEDAEALYKAVKGWGTDEKALINILGHRNAMQREEIKQTYEKLHQENLIKRVESELSGHFERAMYRWMLHPLDRDAVLAHVAMKRSRNIDYAVIIEMACVYSPEELLGVRRAYQARYKHSLEEDLAAHTSGNIRKLLVALVTAYRYDGCEIIEKLAKSEAEILHEAFKDKAFHHEEVIRILTTRSKEQLRATFNRYRDEHATSITKGMFAEKNNDEFVAAMRATIRCISDPMKYYEKVLRYALKGLGTAEDALTRVIVTRAEKDLKMIKEIYYKRNSVNLEHAVAKETSGDYKAFLLTLIGKEE